MSGFSTTSQIFDAAYWRAKEGELARTILASPSVRAARVHIATPERQPFAAQMPVTASVTLTPAGDGIDRRTAKAIRHMIASAIPGLQTGDVAVIDTVNGVLTEPGDGEMAGPAAADPRESQMKAGLERLLAARVGQGKVLVEVKIDADMDAQTITERVIDPASRVAISSELEERTEDATGQNGGAVTVASNLPDGDTDGAGGTIHLRHCRNPRTAEFRDIGNPAGAHHPARSDPAHQRRGDRRRHRLQVAADGTRDWAPRGDGGNRLAAGANRGGDRLRCGAG